MQIFPMRTTGQPFLHSCRHFFGLHFSWSTTATEREGDRTSNAVNLKALDELRQHHGSNKVCGTSTVAAESAQRQQSQHSSTTAATEFAQQQQSLHSSSGSRGSTPGAKLACRQLSWHSSSAVGVGATELACSQRILQRRCWQCRVTRLSSAPSRNSCQERGQFALRHTSFARETVV
jgi:hypothetical protein